MADEVSEPNISPPLAQTGVTVMLCMGEFSHVALGELQHAAVSFVELTNAWVVVRRCKEKAKCQSHWALTEEI